MDYNDTKTYNVGLEKKTSLYFREDDRRWNDSRLSTLGIIEIELMTVKDTRTFTSEPT